MPLVNRLLTPILRPITRLFVGLVAIPLFRLLRRKVAKIDSLDAELEKDIDQWFRASVLLLCAMKNIEVEISSWLDLHFNWDLDNWTITACRLLLAVGVIEAMPDQQLFSIIHPGPPRMCYDRCRSMRDNIRSQLGPCLRGLLCLHLNRSSPVFAIMTVIIGGNANIPEEYVNWQIGWVCYGMAVVQYLIIGLVTSRDKALHVLREFDQQVALRRQELLEDLAIADPSRRLPADRAVPDDD